MSNDNNDKEEIKDEKTSEESPILSEDNKNQESIEEKSIDYKDKYFRALAEIENSKKIQQKLRSEVSDYAIAKFAKEMIEVMDVFEKALSDETKETLKDDSILSFIEGIDLTAKQMQNALKKFNIQEIDAIDKKFDANYHEALFEQEIADKEDGTIFSVMQKGYTIGSRLLRPAKVGVVKNK